MRSIRWVLVNDRLCGELDARLRHWHEAGVSYRAMARLVERETGVRVSRETIRQWVTQAAEANGAAA